MATMPNAPRSSPLYRTARWQRVRRAQLSREPLCRLHRQLGMVVVATVADHVLPHRGDETLFWDETNLQSLCADCHSRHKQAQECTGSLAGCDASGQPIDPSHHWNSRGAG